VDLDDDGDLVTDTINATTISTPVGDLALLEHHDALIAAGFTSIDDQYSRLRTTTPLRIVDELGRFSTAIRAYFDGDVHAIDDLPVETSASKVLRRIVVSFRRWEPVDSLVVPPSGTPTPLRQGTTSWAAGQPARFVRDLRPCASVAR
jgi:hypothetical protein